MNDLSNIDKVFIERSGSATSSGVDYTHSIYFVGNAMHQRDNITVNSLPTVTFDLYDSNCKSLKHFVGGNLTVFKPDEVDFSSEIVRLRGYDLVATEFDGNDFIDAMTKMPTFVDIFDVRRSLPTDRQGYKWTVNYDLSMGNAPSLVCGQIPGTSISQSCLHYDIVDGNYIGGYFILDSTNFMPADIEASAMEAQLELLTDFGDISVTRTGPSPQNGYTWMITWMTASGDKPDLKATNTLLGSGASIIVSEVQKGNYLGGKYNLEYDGIISSDIAYDATADDLKSAITNMSSVGAVNVSESVYVSIEGGKSYEITFIGLGGDVAMLAPETYPSTFTGDGSLIKVFEKRKGSAASGTTLRLSYEAEPYCSQSNVMMDQCGSPITKYGLSYGASAETVGAEISLGLGAVDMKNISGFVPDYTMQKISITSPDLYDTQFYDALTASGYFKLSYNGTESLPISSQATETDMRDVIELFPDVTTVKVSRDFSKEKLSYKVNAELGRITLGCAAGHTCDFGNLPTGEVISVGGVWFKVGEDRSDTARLPLAKYTDSSVSIGYNGTASTAATIYRWGRGYEWTVTFLKTVSPQVLPFTSGVHGLIPDTSLISLRLSDCDGCLLVTGLGAWSNSYLSLSAYNDYGRSSTSVVGVPKEIPNAPTAPTVTSVSGSELKVSYFPPSGEGSQFINSFIIQWDTLEDFSNAESSVASCDTVGYGSCIQSGDQIVTPPFEYFIQNLNLSTPYYVRVTGRNEISLLSANLQKWSDSALGTPINNAPTPPVAVSLIVAGTTDMQVIVTKPISEGGEPITEYKFEWDSSPDFSCESCVADVAVGSSELKVLNQNDYIYEIGGLVKGESYSVRVSARNVIGYSPVTKNPVPQTLAGKPEAPPSVSVSTEVVQDTPIENATVSWQFPTDNGGTPITNYFVEWWQAEAVPEIQVITFKAADSSEPNPGNAKFRLYYSPSPDQQNSTELMNWDVDAYDLRQALINMDYVDGKPGVFGNIFVERNTEPGGKGYAWTVTFDTVTPTYQADLPSYQGNLVNLIGESNSDTGVITVSNNPAYDGSRECPSPCTAPGYAEQQIFEVTADGGVAANITGWFKASYTGSEQETQWLPVSVDGATFAKALGQLSSLRKVTVTTYDIVRGSIVGYGFTISYIEDVGDVPALIIEFSSAGLSSIGTTSWVLYDGDNSVTTPPLNRKVSDAMPGESPKNYMSALVDKDSNTYTISGLIPGQTYYASVSGVNAFGKGARVLTTPSSFLTPKQSPTPPMDVAVDVNPGSTTDLRVSFKAPSSDGGSDVLSYRVELDTSSEFINPLDQTIMCPSSAKRTVWEIAVTSASVSDPIYQGSFSLKVKGKGLEHTTSYIPFDAVSTLSDELGISKDVSVVITATSTNATTNSTIFETGMALSQLQGIVFPGNRLKFSGQKYPYLEYIVNYTTSSALPGGGSSGFTVDPEVEWESTTPTPSSIKVYRVYGGRGSGDTRSRIACGTNTATCYKYSKGVENPTDPDDYNSYIAGSMQAAINAISDIAPAGVNVDRNEVDRMNGITWRVTFLDDSPAEPLDYKLEMHDFQVKTKSGSSALNSVTIKNDGEVFSSCVGSHIVPDKALDPGQFYYTRVFAENEVGFSLPQSSLSAQKPMVVPGPPTSVVLSVYSSNELRVTFNPPVDDGGDTITTYMIEYSTDSSFPVQSTFSTNFTNLGAPAPFFKKIDNLVTGTYYFVRVKAMNSQGYGISSMSVPSSLNPFQTPEGPTNVLLRSTSNSMLTVSFDLPTNNGGDPISSFRVQWDTDVRFNSVSPPPHKGEIDIRDPVNMKSFTITNLEESRQYFVRVFAKNSATAFSDPTVSSPISARPQMNIPGKPHTVIAGTGEVLGSVSVSWQAPFVPWHQIPCSGTVEAPQPCPTDIGGGDSAAFGGGSIVEYQVTYNELEDFSGFDSGSVTTTMTYATIPGLTPGRKYYIKVLARNFAGASGFCAYTDQYCLDIVTRVENVASAVAKA